MKKIILFIMSITLSLIVFAQVPEKMNYQAVIRNYENNLVVNQDVKIRISILLGSESGVLVYSEIQNAKTNDNGLVSLEIGNGIDKIGSFSSIQWEQGTYFLKTEIDPNGGTNYTITGVSQLLSVPYALHAKTADKINISGSEAAFATWDKDASDDFSGDYNDLINKPEPTTVTGYESIFSSWDKNTSDDFSGDYNDLTNKPTIPEPVDGAESVFNGWDKNASDDFSGDYEDLNNKPTIPDPVDGNESAFDSWDKDASNDFSGDYTDLINKPDIPDEVNGSEDVFDGWDKNADDDFSGDYNDLDNKPEIGEILVYTGKTSSTSPLTEITLDYGFYSILSIEIKSPDPFKTNWGIGSQVEGSTIHYYTEKTAGFLYGSTKVYLYHADYFKDCNLQVLYCKTGTGKIQIVPGPIVIP